MTSATAPRAARIGAFVPALALLAVFFAGPLIWAAYSAFTDVALTGSAEVNFIGVDNFTTMWHDAQFWNSLWLTLVFVVGSAVIGQNTLGLLIALLLRGRNAGTRGVVSGLVIAAWTVPEVVAGFCWYSYLHRDGTLNGILGWAGLDQNWLYTTPMLAVILANVWRGTAFSMLVYQAALNDVPPELHEAAAVDGASAWQRLRSVTLPLIRRSIVSNLMLITLQTLAAFGLIYVMTKGGPGTKSSTTPIYMYQESFQFYKLGYGTAMALVLLVIGAIFSLIYVRLIKVDNL
ncbi:sugar ABC transporter permease [Actinoplanes sp. LDG1-06]|uniref:Sugar ABC transporter permease n=1 Tax=Paractinoplanes ovalisporus TaxID=2810368 RepID=A0ABS2A8I8_9ACTN|nr:sugar ABC transporter permease [Actinoplanes ovalisporus]MBM2616138.1 sugar ABC transporter permease [Actinoplanes ovalisporus]